MRTEDQTTDFARWLARHSELPRIRLPRTPESQGWRVKRRSVRSLRRTTRSLSAVLGSSTDGRDNPAIFACDPLARLVTRRLPTLFDCLRFRFDRRIEASGIDGFRQ